MKNKILLLMITILSLTACKTRKNIPKTKPKTKPKNTTVVTKPVTPKTTSVSKTVYEYQADYVEQYKEIAMREMREYGIPASITLAQGLLESGAGRSQLSRQSNNHFGIKCHKGWEGKSVNYDDDKPQECFRKYKNPEASFIDHSKFLTGKKRYAFLFDLPKDNYTKWAFGLKKAGYATSPTYPKQLIKLIKRYNLYQYDGLVLGKKVKKQEEVISTVSINKQQTNNKPKPVIDKKPTPKKVKEKGVSEVASNALENLLADEEVEDTKTTINFKHIHIVSAGETLYSIAKENELTVAAIKQLNNLESNDLALGQKLVLAKEKIKKTATYTVKKGDTLYSLSKKLNVSIADLKTKNNLKSNDLSLGQELKY